MKNVYYMLFLCTSIASLTAMEKDPHLLDLSKPTTQQDKDTKDKLDELTNKMLDTIEQHRMQWLDLQAKHEAQNTALKKQHLQEYFNTKRKKVAEWAGLGEHPTSAAVNELRKEYLQKLMKIAKEQDARWDKLHAQQAKEKQDLQAKQTPEKEALSTEAAK